MIEKRLSVALHAGTLDSSQLLILVVYLGLALHFDGFFRQKEQPAQDVLQVPFEHMNHQYH